MDPRPGERVFFHGHPSWRSMLGLYLKGFLAAIVIGVLAGLISATGRGGVKAGWVAVAVLAVLAGVVILGLLGRRRITYTITDQRLTVDLGLLARDVHETRLERVQNVNCSQSMVERLLRIGTVDFDTAGGAEFDFSFRGVAHPHQLVRTVDRALAELQRAYRSGV